MKRAAIAAACVTGATIPLLMAVVFLFGCCVLPFHDVVHELMPICDFAASILRGDAAGDDAGHEPETTPPAKRIATSLPQTTRLAAFAPLASPVRATPPARYRGFIAHGAVRCDQDVGLHVLVETFRI